MLRVEQGKGMKISYIMLWPRTGTCCAPTGDPPGRPVDVPISGAGQPDLARKAVDWPPQKARRDWRSRTAVLGGHVEQCGAVAAGVSPSTVAPSALPEVTTLI